MSQQGGVVTDLLDIEIAQDGEYGQTDVPGPVDQAAVLGGVMREDCRAILQQFFREQRAKGKK